MKLFSAKSIVNEQPPKVYYIENININYSFHTLENLAKDLGAELLKGDILIVDNENGDKRKAFRKTEHGYIILYAILNKVKFEPLKTKNYKVIDKTMILDVFEKEV